MKTKCLAARVMADLDEDKRGETRAISPVPA